MKVHELIAKLQAMPQDLEVVLSIPAASDYGWEIGENDVKQGDWQEGHFFSEATLERWRKEMPQPDEESFRVRNPAVCIEVGE